MRAPLQGVGNIIRFNWHFYLAAVLGVAAGLWLAAWLGGWWWYAGLVVAAGVLATTVISLAVSWYVYDASGFYRLRWLPELPPGPRLVNIHAGFDETSALLAAYYPTAELVVLDFYDPRLHTEVSIQRARRAYPPYPGTRAVTTAAPQLAPFAADMILLVLAAHEIRRADERADFFRKLRSGLRPGGRIVVVEHLRDAANFFAYSVGAFHFLPRSAWRDTFTCSGLVVASQRKITPFLTLFTLTADATSP